MSAVAMQARGALICALAVAGLSHGGWAQSCLNTAAPLTVEQARLTRVLPGHTLSAPEELLVGAGLDQVAPTFAAGLCGLTDYGSAQAYVQAQGQLLWRSAVNRAQGRVPAGTLPRSDDRPLYWARLQAQAALIEWVPSFALSPDQLAALQQSYEVWSRGQPEISFPADPSVKRIIMSGFDPFTLDAGPNGNGVRTGNPSGATILSLDGTRLQTADGSTAIIHTYILPVNYGPFEDGMQENTIGPFLQPGAQQADASITMSQGGTSVEYDLEQWNGRYHGPSAGNDNIAVCPRIRVDGVLQYQLPSTGQCDIDPPQRWVPHPATWVRDQPPQFTTTSLPVAAMIAANTGNGIAPPPTDAWAGGGAFNVVWHTNFTEFPACSVPVVVTRNTPVPITFPPPVQPTPPDPGACAESGGGGDYLSNESAYRNTLLRDTYGLSIYAGHIHTPIMSHFDPSNLYDVTDPTFEAWRAAIVGQGRNLVFTIASQIAKKP